MIRSLCAALLVLTMVTQSRADDDLAGVWRNALQDSGVSFWELSPKKGGDYVAQEVGLGNRHGTAWLKDGVLYIEFLGEDHKGLYEWRLNGRAGEGTYTQTTNDGDSFKRKTSVRFIGK